MRTRVLHFLAFLVLTTPPGYGTTLELTLTLDSYIGYGAAALTPPDPNMCLSPNCVLFTGTMYDTDTDDSYLLIGAPYTNAADMTDFAGVLSLDNTSPTGLLGGDT